MATQADRLYIIKMPRPKERISRKRLEEKIEANNWGQQKILADGSIAVLQGYLGFMAVDFHVSRYEAKPSLLWKDRLVLIGESQFFDTQAEALAAFEALGS